MIGDIDENTSPEDFEDDFGEEEAISTIVMSDDSVEINVDELVERIEASNDLTSEKRRAVRKRLEELNEQRESLKDMDSTYNFNLDDDVY